MYIDLPLLWACIIAFGVFVYVVLDGFDLGIGILFPWAPDHDGRDKLMTSVAPIWDGNETWLVLGGAALLGAFPLAYAVLLSAFYLPLIVMLIALIFRGVAFEFRFKARTSRYVWDRSFAWGSTLATFAQGVVLGAFIQGVPMDGRDFSGGPFFWLSPFSIVTGLALVVGYALLGACWLAMKTEGPLQDWAFGHIRPLLLALLVGIGVVSLWTPFLDHTIFERWFTLPRLLYVAPVPILVLVSALGIWHSVERRMERLPFFLTLFLFLLSYIGLAISLWPHIIPPSISIWQAAAPASSQEFLLVGVVIMIPIILAYTGYNYWTFRGKVGDAGYHD